MSIEENRAVETKSASGPVGTNRTRSSSTGILRQATIRSPSAIFVPHQIKTMSSNMSKDESRAEGVGGPVGPNGTGGSSGILIQATTRSPSASVENKALGPVGVGAENGEKSIPVIFVPNQIKTMSSNMSKDESRAEGAGGPVGPNGTGGSSGILRQATTRSPSASVENKALGPGAASAAEFAKRVKATPDFGLHLRLRDGD